MKAIFVAGTDTGIGKTLVTSALAAYCTLRKRMDVGVMKPFESGLSVHGKDLLPWDAITLKEAAGSHDDLSLVNPYAFEAPLAPETAAELEHVRVDLERLGRIYEQLASAHDILFVEEAGGILVPITRNFFYTDLIKRWQMPVLVVARLGLGTINHTLLTCRYLKNEGIRVIGVILNDLEGTNDLAARTNPDILERYLDVPLLGIFPHLRPAPQGLPDRTVLADLVEKQIDTGLLLGD
jgi:dethiobiotin synthetase